MRAGLRSFVRLALALLFAAPLLFAWANTDEKPMTVKMHQTGEASVFLVHFTADNVVDITVTHFLLKDHNGNKITCDRVYYLGPSSLGRIELVGYSFRESFHFDDFQQRWDRLEPNLWLSGTPLHFAAVVCNRTFSADETPVLFASSADGTLESNRTVTPVPIGQQSDLCHRISVEITAGQEPTAQQVADAAVSATATVNNAFSRYVSLDDSFFSYSPTQSILRVCARREPLTAEVAIKQLVLSSIFADVRNLVVSGLVLPALRPYLGAATTTTATATPTSLPWSDTGFKCAARPYMTVGDPSVSRCVYERCTSPPELASPMGCYFGTLSVPEAECEGQEQPVPPPQRECSVELLDFAINGLSRLSDARQVIAYKLFFTEETDFSLDDFPLLTVVLDLAGFGESSVTMLYSTATVPQTDATLLPFDLVSFTPTSIVLDFTLDPRHFVELTCTLPPSMDTTASFLFTHGRVYVRRSNILLYSSEEKPLAPGVLALNPDTGKRELMIRGRREVPGLALSPSAASYAILRGSNFGSTTCVVAEMPSQVTVAQEIEDGKKVTLIPTNWNVAAAMFDAGELYAGVFSASSLGDAVYFTVRCILDDNAVVTQALQTHFDTAVAIDRRIVDFTQASPIPEGFVGQLPLSLGTAEPAGVAAALAEALVMPGSSAEVKTIKAPDVESSSGSHIAVLRAPPLLSLLLPSADALEAALPALTGAQLALPDGANATDISRVDLYQAVEQGQWLCGSDGSYNQCDLATANCGDSYSAPLHCVQPNGALDAAVDPNTAAAACAFDETVLPALPQTDGCGSLSCKLPGSENATVPCNDARVCLSLSGCAVDVAITEELISETEALQPVCVKGSDIVDMAYCPASLVPAVEYASTCNATTDCGAVCFSEATGKRVNCDDAWSSCPVTCDGGTRTRAARCADASVPIGDDAAPEVPVALCPNGELGLELSDMCEGDVALCPGPTVNATAADEPGVYTVTWDDAAGKANVETGEALVELIASGAAANDTIVLGIVPVSDFSLSFNASEHGIPAGVYTAVVTFDGVLRGESAEFDILSLCATECLNGGTCNTTTGVCDCVGDWSDETCSTSPCVAKGCNAGGSTCSVDEGGFAQCECKGDWSGDTCSVSPCESKQCNSEGGTCSVDGDGFAQCECKGDWSGEACSVSPCDSKDCDDEHTSACTVTPAGFAQCNCKGEWSGETCTQSPCVAKGCNPEGSECIVTESNTAQCRCFTDNEGAPLFYGTKCDIPADYCEVQAPPCSNGGTRSGEFHSNGSFVCTDCACTQAWESTTDCTTCGLNCAHNTMANADCATCNCPIMGGYSGNLCECRSAYMTFIVRDKDVSQANINAAFDRIHGPDTGASFTEKLSLLFATDLASVTSIRSVQPAVTVATRTSPAGTRYYEIIFSVGPACSGVVPVHDDRMIPTYDAIVALKPFLSAGSHTRNNLVALSALHAPSGFAAHDPNCQLGVRDCPSGWAGNGMFVEADGSLDCEGADAGNPACPDPTTKGGGSGLSTGAIVGIAVGGSVALILILLLVFWAAGIFCFAASKNNRGNTEIPMASV